MKVLLSWLRDFAPVDAAGRRARRPCCRDLGTGRRVGRARRRGPRRRRRGQGARARAASRTPTGSGWSTVDAGGGEPVQVVCGAWNIEPSATSCPWPRVGTVLPDGMEIGRRKMKGVVVQRDAVLAPTSSGSRRRPRRHPRPARRRSTPGHADRRGPGHRARRRLRPRGQPQPPRRHVGRGRGPRPGRPAGRAVHRCPSPPSSRRPGDAAEPASIGRDRRPDLCGRFVARVLRGVTVGPSPRWIASAADPARHAPDQQRRRRVELRDARARPAQPRLRPGPAARAAASGSAGPATGETLVTLDDVERTLVADDLLICDGDDAPSASPASWAAPSTEISDDHHRRAPRDGLVRRPWRSPGRSSASACAPRRRPASRRAPTPTVIDAGRRRLLPSCSASGAAAPRPSTCRGELPDRPPVRVRTARVNAPARHRPRRRPRSPGYLEPIGFDAAPPVEAATTTSPSRRWRPDSADRDRPRRGGRPAPRLRAHRADGARPAQIGRLTPHQRDRRARPPGRWSASARPRRWPIAFLAPADLDRAGLDPTTPSRVTNPLVAEESVLRTSLLPGLLARLAYNASHRQPGVGLFEIGHVFRPAARRPAAARRARARRRRPRPATRPPPPSRSWRALVDGAPCSPTSASSAAGARAPPDPHGARSSSAGRASASVGEVDPAVLAAVGHRRAGRLARARPRAPARGPARRPAVPAREPLPVERRRPRLRGRRDDVPAGDVERTLRGRRATCCRRRPPVRRLPGRPVAAGRRSLAYRSASRPPTAP